MSDSTPTGETPSPDENTPHTRHTDDAQHDDAPPTDAVSDEVREQAAAAESKGSAGELPDDPALTHP